MRLWVGRQSVRLQHEPWPSFLLSVSQWHVYPECFSSPEVDEQADLGRLLDRQIGRLRAFEYSVNVERSRAIHWACIRPVCDQSALTCRYQHAEYRRQPMTHCRTNNPVSMPEH